MRWHCQRSKTRRAALSQGKSPFLIALVSVRVDFVNEPEYELVVLTSRQFLAAILGAGALGLVAGCNRGDPAKTLLLHDSGADRPRRFDDVKVLKKRDDYVKFRTPSGEVIEFSGRYIIRNE